MPGKTQFSLTNNPQMTDFQGTEITNGLFDDGSGYGVNSASDDSLGFVDNLLDPTGFVKGFYNDIMGFTSQEREFEQQMKMTQYENRWNSAQEQMKRAKEAGINPLTAAAGISGGGTGQVAAAGGSATPSSAVADTISKLGGLHSDVAAKSAAAELDSVNAVIAPRVADATIFKNAAEAAKSLVGCGIPEIAAMELGLSFARNGLNGFSNAFNADGLCRRFDLENDEIDARINQLNAQFADTMAHVGVNYSEAQLNGLKSQHQSIINDIEDKRRDLVNRYQELATGDSCLAEWAFMRQYGVDSPEVKGYMDYIRKKFYNQSFGQYSAEVNTIFDKSLNEALAKQEVKNDSAEFESMIRQNEEWIKGFVQFVLNTHTEGNPVSLVSRALNLFRAMTTEGFDEEQLTLAIDKGRRARSRGNLRPRVMNFDGTDSVR